MPFSVPCHALCFLSPRRQLPGPGRNQLCPGHQGEPVQPLVLQQSLLPFLPCSPLLGQGCHLPHPNPADKDALGLVFMSPPKQSSSPGAEQRDSAAGRGEPPGIRAVHKVVYI